MALKSVVEIEVDDKKFKAWLAQSHNISLNPSGGGKGQPSPLTPPSVTHQREKEKKFWNDISRTGLSFSRSLISATASLAKWSTGLALVGGYTAGHFANKVSEERRSARGLGTTTGKIKAFSNAYQTIETPDFLEKIYKGKADITSPERLALKQAGISDEDIKNKDVTALGKQFIEGFKKWASNPHNTATMLGAVPLGTIEDAAQLDRYRAALDKQIAAMGAAYEANEKQLSRSEAQEEDWVQLTTKINLAGKEIENSFIKALTPLAPQLADLTKSVTSVINELSASGAFKDAIITASEGVKEFGHFLTTPEFKEGLHSFLEFLRHPWENTKELAKEEGKKAVTNTAKDILEWGGEHGFDVGKSLRGAIEDSKKSKWLPQAEDQIKLLKSIIGVESGGNPNAVSPKGARGLTQVMPGTAKSPGYGIAPMKNNSPDEYMRFGSDYINAMLNEFKGDMRAAVGAYNAGPGTIKKLQEVYGADWERHTPDETKKYIPNVLNRFEKMSTARQPPNNVTISLNNNTSADPSYQMNKIAQGFTVRTA